MKTLKTILSTIEAYGDRVYAVVQMGDLYDLYSFSRFPRRMFITPEKEIQDGHCIAEDMWKAIRSAVPKAKLYQITGNHDARAKLRMVEKFPEMEILMDIDKIFKFEGVETVLDPKQVLEINGIHFTHGHRSKLGDHMKNMDFKNVVCGHSHTGGVYYHRRQDGDIRWELNVGFVADPFHSALVYRPLTRFFRWTLGFGIIDYWGPRFVPLSAS